MLFKVGELSYFTSQRLILTVSELQNIVFKICICLHMESAFSEVPDIFVLSMNETR